MYQQLPLGPDGSAAIQQLHAKLQHLQSKVAQLDGQAVPRPELSQYGAIEAEVEHFASSLGAISRVTSLLDRLQHAKEQVCSVMASYIRLAALLFRVATGTRSGQLQCLCMAWIVCKSFSSCLGVSWQNPGWTIE